MTRIVCIVCDVAKQSSERLEDRGFCDGCGRRTENRVVADDHQPIAPGSTLRFRDQRELYETTKPKEGN